MSLSRLTGVFRAAISPVLWRANGSSFAEPDKVKSLHGGVRDEPTASQRRRAVARGGARRVSR